MSWHTELPWWLKWVVFLYPSRMMFSSMKSRICSFKSILCYKSENRTALKLLNLTLGSFNTSGFIFPSPLVMQSEMPEGPAGVKGVWAFFSVLSMIQAIFDFLKLDDLMAPSFQGPPRLLLTINLQQFILSEAIFVPWNLICRVQKKIRFPF